MLAAQSQPVPPSSKTTPSLVALVGNPNTGKSTLFNALTGFRQRVANYPGVTVEKKIGPLKGTAHRPSVEILDLPGTYSLAARSNDERIVADVLMGRIAGQQRPDVIVAVLDASNLARNLFLATQVMEMGLPVVAALNMLDVAERNHVRLDAKKLSERLGVPVVPVHAAQMKGIDTLRETVITALSAHAPRLRLAMPQAVERELEDLTKFLESPNGHSRLKLPRPQLLQILLEPGGYAEAQAAKDFDGQWVDQLTPRRERIRQAGIDLADVEAKNRYAWIDRVATEVETRTREVRTTFSDRLDAVLTHRIWGFLIFFGLMATAFQAIYTWASPIMDLVEGLFSGLGAQVATWLPEGALQSLIVDGVIAGVGGVLVFLPQILILFLLIGILEDCGYMARAAMLLHRTMSLFGLNGKAFIPLLSSFACAVPAIMATRTIERSSDRLVTILVAPLMSCSARLPVYTLLIGAFVPATTWFGGFIGVQGLTLFAMYLVGVAVAIPVALILRRGVFRERRQPFLIELPPYQWPQLRTVLYRVFERGREFVVQAGTIIIAVSILVWAAAYFPRSQTTLTQFASERAAVEAAATSPELENALAQLEHEQNGRLIRESYLGRIGRWIEPVVEPLGWDWRIGMAAVASFPAREVIIATLGTIFNLGSEVDEESTDLRGALLSATRADGKPLFNLPVALSIMVFFALCCQCAATLATIQRETHSWRWPVFTFVYMTVLAYVGAWGTYQLAGAWG